MYCVKQELIINRVKIFLVYLIFNGTEVYNRFHLKPVIPLEVNN